MSPEKSARTADEAASVGGWTIILGMMVIMASLVVMSVPFFSGLAVVMWVGFVMIGLLCYDSG